MSLILVSLIIFIRYSYMVIIIKIIYCFTIILLKHSAYNKEKKYFANYNITLDVKE